ncbi:MAG: hypothetical protein WC438_02055 [Candidatus Pacearchaeota archaeon]
MLTKKEAVLIIVFSLVFMFLIALKFPLELEYNLNTIIAPFIIILTSILVKKFASKHYYVDIQHEILDFQRWGWYQRSEFKKPLPIGLILPFFLGIFSLGAIKPFTFFQFKSKPSKLRVLKTRGMIRKKEINESDLAFISAWGFWALILLAIIGSLINFPELTKYSIYYGIWNLLPLGKLDGIKLFFGSFFNWCLLAIAYLISLIIILL